ncbi:MAG: prephenate dehydrogenase [Christensenellales bacterium]|jgi:prephenate dehydrogenase
MDFTISIIGLGMMGTSLAAALQGFRGATLKGTDPNPKAVTFAQSRGLVDEGYGDTALAVEGADLVLLATYPETAIELMGQIGSHMKSGSVLSDICGVKRPLHEAARSLPPAVSFVGGHPMAGRESWGHESYHKDLFRGARYIITPGNAPQSAVALICEMAAFLGCRVTRSTPELHDSMIAYTSQMAHVLAAAITDTPDFLNSVGFEGGSFRDLTRVAVLNDHMWPALFSANADYLVQRLDTLIDNLSWFRDKILEQDRPALAEKLLQSTAVKREYSRRQTCDPSGN